MLPYIYIHFYVFLFSTTGKNIAGTVYIDSGSARFVAGKLDKNGAAYGTYQDTLMVSGWDILDIKSGYGKALTDDTIMYAAGYLEGAFTAK